MNVTVQKYTGEDTGRKISLKKEIFGVKPNDHAIYLDVKQHMANRRQGTHKTKERWEIVGSTRKIKRQKGTGTARAGDIKNPIFRGGGRAFGPRPRDHSFKLNKKLKKLARKSALAYKAKEKNITILEDFTFEAPKTKEYLSMLTKLSVNEVKTLLVLPESNKNIYLSGRNIPNTNVIVASNINTYDVLNADKVVFLESSIDKVETILN